ncbi:MAG: hypothetical protein MUC60_19310 [Oscillatoria sp. Prado101]|nr:hypothetical protein [Oscillatoria sp. Prado101]
MENQITLVEPTPDEVELPPTEDELPYDDGIPMESLRHALQMDMLINPLRLLWKQRQDIFVGANMFVYFWLAQLRKKNFRGADVFVGLSKADVVTQDMLRSMNKDCIVFVLVIKSGRSTI